MHRLRMSTSKQPKTNNGSALADLPCELLDYVGLDKIVVLTHKTFQAHVLSLLSWSIKKLALSASFSELTKVYGWVFYTNFSW
jgi:hypothetical protein